MFDQYKPLNKQTEDADSLSRLGKTVAILAGVLIVALGLCGLTLIAANSRYGGPVWAVLGVFELFAIVVSAVGLAFITPVWIVMLIVKAVRKPPQEDSENSEE